MTLYGIVFDVRIRCLPFVKTGLSPKDVLAAPKGTKKYYWRLSSGTPLLHCTLDKFAQAVSGRLSQDKIRRLEASAVPPVTTTVKQE